jgi:tRNA threonylcarbamoyladenosine biosynthesis protein TsaB
VNLLTLDTTKKQASIGLLLKDEVIVQSTKEHDKHSETLLPKIEYLLQSKNIHIRDIDVFGVLIGPGSFTGIRIGVSMIKAFLFASSKQCVAVNSFELLAYKIKTQENGFLVSLSADGRGAYVAEFDKTHTLINTSWISLKELDELCKTKALPLFVKQEEESYFEPLNTKLNLVEQAHGDLLKLVTEKAKNNQFTTIKELEPMYIRLSQAEDQLHLNFYKKLVFERGKAELLEELSLLETQIFEEEAYKKQSLQEELTSDNRTTIVAKLNGKIIGYVIVMQTPDDMLNIIKIAVLKEYRNLKVATKLFEEVLKLKKATNASKLFLEVNENNVSAIQFYKKMGLKETNRRQKYYKNGDAAIVMFL